MADRLVVPEEDLLALAAGDVIVAFASRHAVDLNDEIELVAGGPRGDSEPAVPPPVGLVGLVVGLQPASSLAGPNSATGPIPAGGPEGDAVILRVFAGNEPVLSDVEFESRRAVVEAMFG